MQTDPRCQKIQKRLAQIEEELNALPPSPTHSPTAASPTLVSDDAFRRTAQMNSRRLSLTTEMTNLARRRAALGCQD